VTQVCKAVVASNNAHKIREINQILTLPGYEFVSLSSCGDFPEPVEDGDSFEANARIKAQAAYAETGLPSLADDSGLVVDALDGAPGIFSARYAALVATPEEVATYDGVDDANNVRLLRELESVGARTPEQRAARFVCTLVFIDENGNELVATGSCAGIIGFVESGAGGFGYDPLFLPDAYNRTCSMAELSADGKNAISHRGAALRALKQLIEEES
jgi:XTP/dITP diphosphohydrolase